MMVAVIWMKMGYPRADLFHVLMHDFHEYVIGDIPSPVKRAVARMSGVKDPIGALERFIDERIREYFKLEAPDAETHRRVIICDIAALMIDAAFFAPGGVFEDCVLQHVVPEELQTEVLDAIQRIDDGISRQLATAWQYQRQYDAAKAELENPL